MWLLFSRICLRRSASAPLFPYTTLFRSYQPEIAQGRLEALLNFQTMVADLTALPITNASLLDEATAAAEAMHLTEAVARPPAGVTPVFMIEEGCIPEELAVVLTGAAARGDANM